MKPSLFIEQIAPIFRPFVSKITEVSDEKQQPLFKELLTEEESITGDWNETVVSGNIVASDIVALGSPLPLAQRPTIRLMSGKIPKIGKKVRLDEKDLKTIQYLIATGRNNSEVRNKILSDTARLIKGQDMRLEQMFYQALSTGIMQAGEDETEGTAIRVSFKREENEVQTENGWDTPEATPIQDLYTLFGKIEEEGKTVNVLYLTNKALDKIKASKEGKDLVKTYLGQAASARGSVSREATIKALEDEFAVSIVVVTGRFVVSNSKGTTQRVGGFNDDYIVATPAGKLGRVVYTRLPEEDFPVEGVSYAKAGRYNLVSKFGNTDPVEEYTAIQAMVIPVLDANQNIFRLKTSV